MHRRDFDIKITIINIVLVVGLLLFIGAVNLMISGGFSQRTAVIGGLGLGVAVLSIVGRVLYNKYVVRNRPKVKVEDLAVEETSDS